MKRIYFLFAACLLFSGCARGHWAYPGSAAEANRLAYDCQYMANMQAKGTGGFAQLIADSQFESCMRSRGFVWIVENKTPQKTSSTSQTYPEKGSKYNYGFVDLKEVARNSKYLQNYFANVDGTDLKKGEATFYEIKRHAQLYCKEYKYDFMIVKGWNHKDFDNSYLCPPRDSLRNEDLSKYNDGNASRSLASFIDRTTGTTKPKY